MIATIVVLPGLVAGTRLDAPPTPGEITRVEAALRPPGPTGSGSEVARQFLLSTVPWGTTFPTESSGQAELIGKARLAQVGSVLGLGLLVYVAVLLARGRLQALLACAFLATLPPVAVEGHVLRPEAPATLFAVLALVLLQCIGQPRGRNARPAWFRSLFFFGLSLCTSVAMALAVAALPSTGECLLVPGIVLTVAAVQLGLRSQRIGRRIGWLRVPIRSINARLLPWTATALLAPAMTWLVLTVAVDVPVEALPATTSSVRLLPGDGWLCTGFELLVLVGALVAVLRVGLRFGRGGRIGADLVLLVFCAVFLAASLGGAETKDSLPVAPAMAVLLSEGAHSALVGLRLALARRSGR